MELEKGTIAAEEGPGRRWNEGYRKVSEQKMRDRPKGPSKGYEKGGRGEKGPRE